MDNGTPVLLILPRYKPTIRPKTSTHVRLSDKAYEWLTAAAHESGLSLSEVAERVIAFAVPYVRFGDEGDQPPSGDEA